jgi:hypothetical protein
LFRGYFRTSRKLALSGMCMLGLFLGNQAYASESHPPLMPEHDAKIVYEVQPQGAPAPRKMTLWFAAEGARMRIDSGDGVASTIIDRGRDEVLLVLHPKRIVMRLNGRQGARNPFMLDAGMDYARQGEQKIAGLTCMDWQVTTPKGQAQVCVTSDGLVLSQKGVDADGITGEMKAESVSFDPIAESEFGVPAGYSVIERPSHAPTAGPTGGQGSAGQDQLPGQKSVTMGSGESQ